MTTVRPESRPHERPQFSSLHTNKGTESLQIDAPSPSTGEYQEYTSIQDLWESVRRLQYELEMARPKEPLSGRIIQVVYSLPFNFTPRKEHDHIQRKAHAEAAKNSVARMAATARARKLQREQHGLLEAKKAEKTSILDSMDVDPIQKNQEHVGRVAGRRAWMLSELVDDDVSEDDQLSAINSHIHKTSSSEFKEIPSSSSKCTGFGERGGTSSCTPGSTKLRRPPWILSLSRGHSALNSGIYSLCASHKQTYIGAPIHMRFCQQSELDTRSEVSQTTPEERKEIEAVLASLENRSTWSLHEGGLAMRPPDLDSDNNEDIAGIRYVPTWLDHQSAYSHYEAYCKATLWPLFHYMMWRDDEDRTTWDQHSWQSYVKVNQAFAERVATEHKPGDIVWIHDYHLLLVPLLVRRMIPDIHIGVFVHSSFPSSEFFRCLPQRHDILEGMLGADLICFQNQTYARHFLSCCVRICGLEVQGNFVESANGRVTKVGHSTIGIDVERVRYEATQSGIGSRMQQLRNLYKDKRIIVGCDKLDVVRGVIQKLQAFYELLLHYPRWRNNVVLIQITIPAMHSSPKLERQVSELVSLINGDFGSLSFTPVQHYHQLIKREEYYALLSVADLALVTSVRDGMNTMSMEYVVCQNEHGQSPIIISEFTGTAVHLQAAIQINPWDIGGVAAAIHHSLCISDQERYDRNKQCHEQVVSKTSHTWALSLVQQMLHRLRHRYSAHSTPIFNLEHMLKCFKPAKKRLFLLDYDGTLTPIVKDPSTAVPSQRLLEALQILSNDDRNIMYIISGRDEAFLSKYFSQFPAMGLSAEHGSYFKEHGSQSSWQNLSAELDMSWKQDVLNVFRYFTDRTIGSNIEEKKSSIVWHYRNADPDFGSFQAKECQSLLDNILSQNDLQVEVVVGKKNVEVRPLAINKGEIVHRLLYAIPDVDFVFCAGDDKTDEDMFRFLSKLAYDASDEEPLSSDRVSTMVVSPPAPLSRNSYVNATSRNLNIRHEQIFTLTVGPASKRTRADWHVGDVNGIIDSLVAMAHQDERE